MNNPHYHKIYSSSDNDLIAENMRKIPVTYSNSLTFHSSGLNNLQMYKQNIKNQPAAKFWVSTNTKSLNP